MIPGNINTDLISGDEGGYQISRSLRFNSSDSAYLSRTPSVAGNRKTWTWSGWVKRSALGTAQNVFGNFSSGGIQGAGLRFDATDQLSFFDFSSASPPNWQLLTSAVFRDVSAWFHLVAVLDTTNATADNRVRLYINGIEQTVFSTRINPSLNYDGFINNTNLFGIGRGGSYAADYFSGYLADIHFIDGQALTPSSFAETNATTGQWVPKAYSGSYGTNGFRLDFSDNSAATAATLGKDTSGNGNNWTPNNLSVTAGAGNDSLVDTPTSYGTNTGAGGEVRGNYAIFNPLLKATNTTLSNGNLDFVSATGGGVYESAISTIGVSSGKWYAEFLVITVGNDSIAGVTWAPYNIVNGWPGGYANSIGYEAALGKFYKDGVGGQTVNTYGVNDVIGVALDLDNAAIWFSKNGTWQGTGSPNPATNTSPAYSSLTAGTYFFAAGTGGSGKIAANFGQRPFAYTAPSGFKALCDTNLTAGTITTSGSFTGNANADGPFIWLNGVPTAMTINGNSVTFGTHADKLANGFKLRTSSTSYNLSGTNNFSVTTTGDKFKFARAQTNP